MRSIHNSKQKLNNFKISALFGDRGGGNALVKGVNRA